MGDFNTCNLSQELPNYKQLVTCATWDNNTLDHFYSTITPYPRAPLGHSDHSIIQMVPTYRQQLKRSKPSRTRVRRWTPEARDMLQDCMKSTDWESLRAPEDDNGSFADTLCSYISFCEQVCLPTKTITRYNNQEPWFSKQLRELRHQKEHAFREGDMDTFRLARQNLNRPIKKAKRDYSARFERDSDTNDSAVVWSTLRSIINYKPCYHPLPQTG